MTRIEKIKDYINNMSVEEMAASYFYDFAYISKTVLNARNGYCEHSDECTGSGKACASCREKWLNEEVSDEMPESNLPKGWIVVRDEHDRVMIIDATKIVSVEDCSPTTRRIIRFSGTTTYSSESIEEIVEKIKEATSK